MQDFLFVKDGNDYVHLNFADILYIEASDKYSKVFTPSKKYLVHLPLNIIEKNLPSRFFCRIHRSYIISLIHTTSFNQAYVVVAGKKIQIGKHYKEVLPHRIQTFSTSPKNYVILSDYDFLSLFRKLGPN